MVTSVLPAAAHDGSIHGRRMMPSVLPVFVRVLRASMFPRAPVTEVMGYCVIYIYGYTIYVAGYMPQCAQASLAGSVPTRNTCQPPLRFALLLVPVVLHLAGYASPYAHNLSEPCVLHVFFISAGTESAKSHAFATHNTVLPSVRSLGGSRFSGSGVGRFCSSMRFHDMRNLQQEVKHRFVGAHNNGNGA